MNNKLMFFAFILSTTFMVSCSTKEKQRTSVERDMPSREAQQAARAEDASHVAEFSFPKGSSELTETAKQDLRQVIDQAKRSGDIKDLKVITWGDAEYPSKEEKKLSSTERDLVKKRNKAIRDYIKTYNNEIDVETYSMAERPGILKEMLNTPDVRVKRSLETAGIQSSGKTVRAPAKASKSVIMVILE